MVKQLDSETLREYLIRYYTLMEYLDKEAGYGTYIITLHGKRPVKIRKVSPAQILEHASGENLPDSL
jgi:hypothetical protein